MMTQVFSAPRNVDPDMDVLNHINADYFELMQPGMDALDFISCPGEDLCKLLIQRHDYT